MSRQSLPAFGLERGACKATIPGDVQTKTAAGDMTPSGPSSHPYRQEAWPRSERGRARNRSASRSHLGRVATESLSLLSSRTERTILRKGEVITIGEKGDTGGLTLAGLGRGQLRRPKGPPPSGGWDRFKLSLPFPGLVCPHIASRALFLCNTVRQTMETAMGCFARETELVCSCHHRPARPNG